MTETAKQQTLIDEEPMIAESEPIEAEIVNDDTPEVSQPATQLATVPATPLIILQSAVASGRDPETLERLMALHERWEANQARNAYNAAMSKFRCEQITVLRSTCVNDGPLKGKNYAKLVDFVNVAVPPLSACGLSATWRITRDEKDWIEVACLVSHVDGHQESTTMGGPPDTGGAKNPIQARASTVSYLQKYTLKMALGLAEQNDDKDGNSAIETIGDGQIAALNNELERMPDSDAEIALKDMLKWANIDSMEKLQVEQFTLALAALRKKADKYVR